MRLNKYNNTFGPGACLTFSATRPGPGNVLETWKRKEVDLINITVKDLDGLVHEIEAREGDSLMETLREYEWGVPAICGGLCSCGTCHVYLDTAWLDKFPPPDSDEQDLLDAFDSTESNSRLSCQIKIDAAHDGLSLSIAPEE
jgi:2Fe-2S ferredoxin